MKELSIAQYFIALIVSLGLTFFSVLFRENLVHLVKEMVAIVMGDA